MRRRGNWSSSSSSSFPSCQGLWKEKKRKKSNQVFEYKKKWSVAATAAVGNLALLVVVGWLVQCIHPSTLFLPPVLLLHPWSLHLSLLKCNAIGLGANHRRRTPWCCCYNVAQLFLLFLFFLLSSSFFFTFFISTPPPTTTTPSSNNSRPIRGQRLHEWSQLSGVGGIGWWPLPGQRFSVSIPQCGRTISIASTCRRLGLGRHGHRSRSNESSKLLRDHWPHDLGSSMVKLRRLRRRILRRHKWLPSNCKLTKETNTFLQVELFNPFINWLVKRKITITPITMPRQRRNITTSSSSRWAMIIGYKIQQQEQQQPMLMQKKIHSTTTAVLQINNNNSNS